MCTAAAYKTKDFYFGRTLDYEFSYGEKVVITPRNFEFKFRHTSNIKNHYAIIGMSHVAENIPLYYDAVNEKGLAMAGLNFVGNAFYSELTEDKCNIAQFEFIPWILSQCATVEEAAKIIEKMALVKTPFSKKMPVAQLHWMIADRNSTIVVESVREGIKVYDNPVKVLTNNPPFPMQMISLNNYMGISPKSPENRFSKCLSLYAHSRGMGAIGLPGDLSSQSRFVRAAFVLQNSVSGKSEKESVSQFFHILGSVEQPRGCCEIKNGEYEITIYTSCCNADKGIYYYTTYDNHRITAVDMRLENLNGNKLICFDLVNEEQIKVQNFHHK